MSYQYQVTGVSWGGRTVCDLHRLRFEAFDIGSRSGCFVKMVKETVAIEIISYRVTDYFLQA
jgi:hypothetical protein